MKSLLTNSASRSGQPLSPPCFSAPHPVSLLLAVLCLNLVTVTGCKQKSSPEDTSTAISSNPDTRSQPTPIPHKHIYTEDADPNAEIANALQQARSERKRVLLDFGGDWCGDCQVLDVYFHQSPNLDLLSKNFVLVHIDIGHMDKNLSTAEKYSVPVSRGVPALAVLDSNGKLLFSQQNKEFENMRNMDVNSVTQFLNQWKS